MIFYCKVERHCERALLRGPVYPSLQGNRIAIDEAIQLKIL
ncbi:hypothetical protein RPATATE_1042 [Rickettsia parkeri str. Tate's Hell]|uniref:Uncharacterized protein n=1 Tax=Rickettsia parkeri str. Tate's Hell TaxID=1359189 RepID=A0ABR5DR43_RICPA|nr:hypothetical protein RPAAT24_1481 [Rickettsia parkeri str. AT\